MKFTAYEYDVGEHFLSALINGDVTGLDDEEEEELNEWTLGVTEAHGRGGHWAVLDSVRKDFARCAVTDEHSTTERVAYMVPTKDEQS